MSAKSSTFVPVNKKTDMQFYVFLIAFAAFASRSIACSFMPDNATENALADSISKNISLDEVEVVSMVKENTAMRQQPSSVSLISKQQLELEHITSLKGVSALVPNFFMPDYGSRLTSAVYIRGIGSRINTPAVGMYVDNVPYVDKSAFDFNFFDIERVDVMRGPQGTLYGRNAMGGIIRVYTKNPFSYEGTDVKVGYATADNHRSISATHYQTVNSKFAFSGGGYYEGGDGFFKNAFTEQNADKIEAGGGRIRGIYKPSDRLNFDLSISYDYSDEGAYPYYYLGNPFDSSFDASVGTICNNREHKYRRGLLNTGLNIEYKAPSFVMNAITGYQNINDRMFMDQDFISKDIYTLEQRQKINTVTEEVTFKNANKDSRWNWVSGVNFMYQTLATEGPVHFYDDGLRWLESNINSHMPDVTAIPSLARMGFTSMSVNMRGDDLKMGGTFDTPLLNTAVFHQSTLRIAPKLLATLGLRLDYEKMSMTYNAPATVDYGFLLANPRAAMMQVDLQDLSSQLLYDGKMHEDYLTVLPKASIMYKFSNNSNVYALAAKGQRSGGYNVQMFSDILQGAMQNVMMTEIQSGVAEYLKKFTAMGMPASVIESVTKTMADNMPIGEDPSVDQVVFKPEYSWNFELGTHLGTADRKYQLDAAVFLISTHDQQIARFAPTGLGRMMVNAGKSRSYGAELTALCRPDAHWTFTANYGFTQATFTDYDAGNGTDYTGNYVPFVPKHTLHLDAAYTWQLGKSWAKAITLGADYSGAGSLYWTESNNSKQSYYSLLGARLALDTGNASFQLWARNLTDTNYRTFGFESAHRSFEQLGKPMQLGIDVRFSIK